jgi:hypothetical protein
MFLYHASQHKNLVKITPQKTLSHDKYIGNFVFATANKIMAIMYLSPKGFATLMNPDDSNPDIVVCGTVEDFIKRDLGGAVYKLPSAHFTKTPQKGLSDYEMVSTHTVEPLGKTTYNSALEAMLHAGIEVRFTDAKTFKSLIRNPNQADMIKQISLYSP